MVVIFLAETMSQPDGRSYLASGIMVSGISVEEVGSGIGSGEGSVFSQQPESAKTETPTIATIYNYK